MKNNVNVDDNGKLNYNVPTINLRQNENDSATNVDIRWWMMYMNFSSGIMVR